MIDVGGISILPITSMGLKHETGTGRVSSGVAGLDAMLATRRIRGLDFPMSAIPIVALSGNVMAEQIARCREAGMNDHLARPIDREMLRRAVATWATRDAQ